MNDDETTALEAHGTLSAVNPIEQVRSVLFPDGDPMMVIRIEDADPEALCADKLVTSAEEAAGFIGNDAGQFCLQTFAEDGEPLAYVGLAAVMKADHYVAPTITLMRAADDLRVGIWRLATAIPVTDQKSVQTLEDIARGLGNDSAADPAPLPGSGGWSIVEMASDRVYTLDQMKRAPVHLHGTLDPDLLGRTLELSISPLGKKTKPGHWSRKEMTAAECLYMMGAHDVGGKNGNALLQGVALEGTRVKAAMERLYVLGLDLDTGESLASLRQKIQAEGWFALIWSTHSHLTTISDPVRDQVMRHAGVTDRDPTLEEGVRYLQDVKRIKDWVLDGAELRGFKHEPEGVKMLIAHKPLPKYRAVFVLNEPFYPARRGGTHAAGMTEWSERYAGVSQRIGAVWDRSCVDVSRLFYTARHPANAKEWHVEVIAGAPLDLEKIDRVKDGADSNPFGDAARQLGGGQQFQTPGLLRFWTKHKHTFEMRAFFEDRFPENQREGRHFQCPNDGNHGDPGNPEDQGFAVWNADESESQQAVGYCQHDTCKALCAGPGGCHDSLPLLDLACQEAGIRDASELLEWVPDTVEDDDDEKPASSKPEQPTEWTKGDGFDELCVGFNKVSGFVSVGESGKYVEFDPDAHTFQFHGIRAFERLYDHVRVVMKVDGREKLIPFLKLWTSSDKSAPRKFNRLTFQPNRSQEEVFPRLNTWRSLGVQPEQGDWSLMRRHIWEVLAGEDQGKFDVIIGWMARHLQTFGDLDKKFPLSLVVKGEEGVGKSIIFEAYCSIFGRHGVTLSNPGDVLGNFNSHLAEAVFILMEEAFFGGDPRIKGPLKHLLSGRKMMLEYKGVDKKSVPNFAQYVIISNEDLPVPIEPGSRRFYVVEASSQYRDDSAYFRALAGQIKGGGVAAMVYDLQRYQPADGDWSFLHRSHHTEESDRMLAMKLKPFERLIIRTVHEAGYEADNDGKRFQSAFGISLDQEVEWDTDRIRDSFIKSPELEDASRHQREDGDTDKARLGAQISDMLPNVGKRKSNGKTIRIFPPQAKLIADLRKHRHRGYGAYLDELAG